MKKLTIFEVSILGFFVGIVVAAYLTYVVSTYGVAGTMIGTVSFYSVFASLKIPEAYSLVAAFGFFTFLYTMYGLILGLLMQAYKKIYILAPVAILAGLITVEQQNLLPLQVTTDVPQVASVVRSVQKDLPMTSQQQYFGQEAVGDLNDDGEDDVAFLIPRPDDVYGTVYYLSTALATTTGRSGTNLIFLGNDVVPHSISIESGDVKIPFEVRTNAKVTKVYTARLVDGVLTKISVDM